MCEPNQYQCANRKCVLKTWLCDSEDDCGDGSDERNCGVSDPRQLCLPVEYKCDSNTQCVPKSFHCDGQSDCADGSDEIGCGKNKFVVFVFWTNNVSIVVQNSSKIYNFCSTCPRHQATGSCQPETQSRRNFDTSVRGRRRTNTINILAAELGPRSWEMHFDQQKWSWHSHLSKHAGDVQILKWFMCH